MYKHFIMIAMVAIFASCGNNKSTTPRDNGLLKAESSDKSAVGSIAYVDVDSLMTQLDMCRDGKAALEAKSAQYRKELDAKSASFQKEYAAFAQKMQTTGYASQAEYEAAQQRLQQLQENGSKQEMRYAEALQKEQDAFNARLHDSLNSYIRSFNADHRYSMILAKSGDNVLYADPALDITSVIVTGMNKRYKK